MKISKRGTRLNRKIRYANIAKICCNTEDEVRTSTEKAFAMLKDDKDNDKVLDSLRILWDPNQPTKLKGVGFVTSTLILSSAYPWRLPFFSEELRDWFFPRPKTNDKGVPLDEKHYKLLLDLMDNLLDRLGRHSHTAVKVEKVAYVIATTKVLQSRFLWKEGTDKRLQVINRFANRIVRTTFQASSHAYGSK